MRADLSQKADSLQEGSAHLWKILYPLDTTASYAGLLSKGELTRAGKLRTKQLRDRFTADHGILRILLGSYLDCDPKDIAFTTNQYGKPSVSSPASCLSFNMSHSGALTMIAICLGAEIGLDVEAVRPIPEWEDIAASHFSSREIASIRTEPWDEQQNAFFRCWTRKEAFIKAMGMGLSIPLHHFSVSTSLSGDVKLLHCDWNTEETARWSLAHLNPHDGYVGAFATNQAYCSIVDFQWC
ncbi:MAG TPA: 4'-phosphopantetheinyl transferase superfamily protein [Alloacidobacterium sp.]|nr:4'-phosphopantetheinyl transferase superfamily protein [Alloacidobacterium sp.]